jgi:hypothetical protein
MKPQTWNHEANLEIRLLTGVSVSDIIIKKLLFTFLKNVIKLGAIGLLEDCGSGTFCCLLVTYLDRRTILLKSFLFMESCVAPAMK